MRVPRLHISKKVTKILITTVVVLVAIRVALPEIAKRYINHTLATKMDQYTGHIEDFDLSIYRGAYQIQGLEILKRNTKMAPILAIEEIDISLAWRALLDVWLKGEVTADVILRRAVVQIQDSSKPSRRQLAVEEGASSWQSALAVIIPLQIETLTVQDSEISFINNDLKAPLPVKLTRLEFRTRDLRNRPKGEKEDLSPMYGHALLGGHAPVHVVGGIDILADPMRLDLNLNVKNFKVETINQLLLVYVPLDLTRGKLSVYSELAISGDKLKGYGKIFFEDGDIIAPKQKYQSWKHIAFEYLGAIGNWILKNNETKKVATKIEFSGQGGKYDFDTSEAFWAAVKNLWKKIPEGLENSINIKSIEGSTKKPTRKVALQ